MLRRSGTWSRRGPARSRLVAIGLAVGVLVAACSDGGGSNGSINARDTAPTTGATTTTVAPTTTTQPKVTNVYEFTQAGMMSPAVQGDLSRVYVPNGGSNSVSVIDPTTYEVINT